MKPEHEFARKLLIAELAKEKFNNASEMAHQGGIEQPQESDFIDESAEFVDRCLTLGKQIQE